MKLGILILGLGATFPIVAQSVSSYDHIPDVTYDEIADRISCLESGVPLNFNEKVHSFVDYFTLRDREYTREVMRNSTLYFPIFEEYLRKYNLPEELKYLAIVESGLRANAISRAGAVGLWQFMPSTGKLYGLNVNWYVDDRMDPIKSTDAACRHLRDLYNMFGNWELALAAYNAGPGNVRKAIRRSDYREKFWDIYAFLPRETRSYVPQFVAIMYTLSHAADHNLFVEDYKYFPRYDTIRISQYFHLETFAAQLDVCEDDLLALNTSVRRGALPEETRNHGLRVPEDLKASIVENREFLYDTASKVGKEHLDFLARNMPGSTYGREKQIHQVRSGDVLGAIAAQYHVRIEDIKAWNNLSSNTIRIGQRLNIWVLPNYTSETKDLYASKARTTTQVAPQKPIAGQKTHQVKAGETLWSIANRYTGLSIERIKQLNHMTTSTIWPGQNLIISAD